LMNTAANRPMIRVVVDSNVVVSAFYFPGGKPGKTLALIREGELINFTSKYILDEVKRILKKKFLWSDAQSLEAVDEIISFSEIVDPPIELTITTHDPDNRILECAVAGRADFIISGDRHLTSLRTFQAIKIVDPATFLAIITGGG